MAYPSDMLEPVTRGELQEELKQLRLEIKQAIEPLATKVELELWGGALRAQITSDLQRSLQQQMQQQMQHIQQMLQQQMLHMQQQLQNTQQQLQLDLARHANALHESMVALVHAHDEKYTDLPGRVRRLESAVFDPTPR